MNVTIPEDAFDHPCGDSCEGQCYQCGSTELHEPHGRCAGLDGTEVEG
jgi:hypothetical protein